jgi:hypothetical protein
MGYPIQFNVVNEEADEPEKLHRRIDLGSAWHFGKWWVFEPKLAFDVRDILHPNWSFIKGLHAGAELYWRMFNWWKGYWSFGVNQGYYTAGFGARMAWFQLDVATFGEEVGTNSEKIESRRYMVDRALTSKASYQLTLSQPEAIPIEKSGNFYQWIHQATNSPGNSAVVLYITH